MWEDVNSNARNPRVLMAIAGVALITCGCTSAGHGGSSGSNDTSSNCEKSFKGEPSPVVPGGRTPREALNKFFTSGSVNGELPPHESPTTYGFPRQGWKEEKVSAGSVRFAAGRSSLTAVHTADGSWQVIRGALCK